MTDETFTRAPRRSRSRLGVSLTLAAAIAAGAAGFATGRHAPVTTLQAQEVTRAEALPIAGRSGASASYSDVVERVAPAVVTVRVERRLTPMETALPPQLRDFFRS